MYKTIAMQAAEIPRPKLKGTEIEPGVVVFNMARTAIKAAKPAEIAPELPVEDVLPVYQEPSIGRKILQYFNDGPVRVYDYKHKTNFYEALKQKRSDERDVKFAASIGLLTLDDVTCQKHRHAIAKMHGLTE